MRCKNLILQNLTISLLWSLTFFVLNRTIRGVAYSSIILSLSACECCEQVSCNNALLDLDVNEIVEHDNGGMFDNVDLDDIVDVELCDGEKRLPFICFLSLGLLLFSYAALSCFLLA